MHPRIRSKPYPSCWTYININSTYTTYATPDVDAQCTVLQVNNRLFPLEVPIKFHWRSPLNSTGGPHIFNSESPSFPLEVPIPSIESPHVSTEAPHTFHWRSPSSRTPHGTTTDPYKPRFCGGFGGSGPGTRRLAVEVRYLLSIGSPHNFHWRSPSADSGCSMGSERAAEGSLSGPLLLQCFAASSIGGPHISMSSGTSSIGSPHVQRYVTAKWRLGSAAGRPGWTDLDVSASFSSELWDGREARRTGRINLHGGRVGVEVALRLVPPDALPFRRVRNSARAIGAQLRRIAGVSRQRARAPGPSPAQIFAGDGTSVSRVLGRVPREDPSSLYRRAPPAARMARSP